MRLKARKDANQSAIIAALEAIGASVAVLNNANMPDLIVGYRGVNTLIEVKDGDKPPSKQKLRPNQKAWHGAWRGQVDVVTNIDSALKLVAGLQAR